MPLHADAKGMVRQFDCFDKSIWGMTCYTKRRSNILKSLVVQAVDLENGFSHHLRDMCPFFHLDIMNKHRPPVAGVGMIERVGKLVVDVRVQGSAEGNVHHLAAAADAEEGFAV